MATALTGGKLDPVCFFSQGEVQELDQKVDPEGEVQELDQKVDPDWRSSPNASINPRSITGLKMVEAKLVSLKESGLDYLISFALIEAVVRVTTAVFSSAYDLVYGSLFCSSEHLRDGVVAIPRAIGAVPKGAVALTNSLACAVVLGMWIGCTIPLNALEDWVQGVFDGTEINL